MQRCFLPFPRQRSYCVLSQLPFSYPYRGKVDVELKLQALPEIRVRPQEISTVFSNLLRGAVERLSGSGRLVVTTELLSNYQLRIAIKDCGVVVSPEELARIFDLSFQSEGTRVTAGNWSFFSARQVVREHGGEIRVESEKGKGTKVEVTLPAEGEPTS